MPKLQFTTPDGASYEFEISADRSRIGRADDNDFVLPDGSVSSRHAEIVRKGDGIEVVDLGSTNGTHVGGQRVDRADIAPGGKFKLGSVDAVFVADQLAGEDRYEDEPMPVDSSDGSWNIGAGSTATITGLGATSCPGNLRHGFGPKEKKKDKAAGLLVLLAVVSLLVCAAAAFMIFQMGA